MRRQNVRSRDDCNADESAFRYALAQHFLLSRCTNSEGTPFTPPLTIAKKKGKKTRGKTKAQFAEQPALQGAEAEGYTRIAAHVLWVPGS